MFDWFDLMRQAQNSAATNMLTQQFQLKPEQTQAVMAAFLPAFAMGMQHAMSPKPDPMVQSLFGGAYQNLWQNAAQAFSPSSQRNGEQILDHVFGSDETSRRVARQAAEMTGVNADVMQQMLPVLAGIYAGGLYHWVSGQTRAIQKVARPEPDPTLPDFMENWTRLCTAWAGEPDAKAKPPQTPFEEMMAGFFPQDTKASAPEPAPKARSRAKPASEKPPAWEEMMEKGRDLQKQYLASLQSIFEEAQSSISKKS